MSSAISGISGLEVDYSELLEDSNTTLGQMDFLELLMIQLQCQDPLNPMDSQEFSAQLAQFSQLEQITQMNENLSTFMETNLLLTQSVNNVMATSMIGQSVVAYGNEVELVDGQEATINYELAGSAQTVTIEIMDENGTVVRTIEVNGQSSGDQQVVWDGLDDAGNVLADDVYTYSVSAETASGTDVSVTTYTSGVITGVSYVEGMAELMVGSIQISLGDIYRIIESS